MYTTTGGTALSKARWAQRQSVTTISFAAPNPVEVSPQQFTRIIGQQFITVTDLTTGFIFTFVASGGSNALSGGYLTLYDPSANYYYADGSAVNCAISTSSSNPAIPVNTIVATTPAGDSGGRVYTFVFSIFAGTKPTIFKTSGTALAGGLTVVVTDILIG